MSFHSTQNQRPSMKLILVGSSGVGKSCLISSYLKKTFDEKKTSTVAPSFAFKDVKNSQGITVRLQIWDTAGQERYHSVSQLFFRDSDVAFICFEAGEEVSYKAVPDWIKSVRSEVPNCDVFIVITKADMHTQDELERIITEAHNDFAIYEPRDVYITSSKTQEGVHELFASAAELYKQKEAASTKQHDITEESGIKSKKCC